METIRSIEQVIERVGDLPAIPSMVAEVLRMTDDPLVDMADVTEVIERDPAMTAKILRVSNSPYYGMKQYVGTLKLALVILGVREVRNIVLGVAVFESLRDGVHASLVPQAFWSHSFLVGGLSKHLAAALSLGMQGEAFICGLLHDIGKLVLLRQLKTPYARLLESTGGHSATLCHAELSQFGFTHADAAAALAERWNFPKTLADAIHFHHARDGVHLAAAKDPRVAAVVRLANSASHHDFSATDVAMAGEDGEAEAWGILDRAPAPIEPARRNQVLGELLGQLIDSPLPQF